MQYQYAFDFGPEVHQKVLEKIEKRKRKERDIYQRYAFPFCLTDVDHDRYIRNRKIISTEVEEFHKQKKQAQKNRNFELAKFIGKELIKPHESLRKAFSITDFFLLGNGTGRIKPFPIELIPYIKQIEEMILYEIDWQH